MKRQKVLQAPVHCPLHFLLLIFKSETYFLLISIDRFVL